jgi:hypothetical protein
MNERTNKMARKILKEVMFEEDEFEICIKCGKLTNIEKTSNVVYRSGYIDGAGQLCFICSQTKEKYVDNQIL